MGWHITYVTKYDDFGYPYEEEVSEWVADEDEQDYSNPPPTNDEQDYRIALMEQIRKAFGDDAALGFAQLTSPAMTRAQIQEKYGTIVSTYTAAPGGKVPTPPVPSGTAGRVVGGTDPGRKPLPGGSGIGAILGDLAGVGRAREMMSREELIREAERLDAENHALWADTDSRQDAEYRRKTIRHKFMLGGGTSDEALVAESLRAMYSTGKWKPGDSLLSPGLVDGIAQSTGWQPSHVANVLGKIVATGASGLTFAATGNFPVAAMAYFTTDKLLNPQSTGQKDPFTGMLTPGVMSVDGVPMMQLGIEVPEGLPNEVFSDYQFVCYDHISGKWYPSDEVRPLPYQSNEPHRWTCLNRLDGRIYHANQIKTPRIFL